MLLAEDIPFTSFSVKVQPVLAYPFLWGTAVPKILLILLTGRARCTYLGLLTSFRSLHAMTETGTACSRPDRRRCRFACLQSGALTRRLHFSLTDFFADRSRYPYSFKHAIRRHACFNPFGFSFARKSSGFKLSELATVIWPCRSLASMASNERQRIGVPSAWSLISGSRPLSGIVSSANR